MRRTYPWLCLRSTSDNSIESDLAGTDDPFKQILSSLGLTDGILEDDSMGKIVDSILATAVTGGVGLRVKFKGNKISDMGAKSLTKVLTDARFNYIFLDLEHNNITSAGATRLYHELLSDLKSTESHTKHTKFVHLKLTHNQISARVQTELDGMKNPDLFIEAVSNVDQKINPNLVLAIEMVTLLGLLGACSYFLRSNNEEDALKNDDLD